MDAGELSLWGAMIDPGTLGIESEPAVPLSLSQNAPNPFHEYTFFSFKLQKPSTVTLKVYDLLGNNVATIISNEMMSSGKHVVHFSPERYNLPSGIYHYSLVTDNRTFTKKMIYSK
jgi:hypothetical protein